MNLSLTRRLNEILKQHISAADHERIREEIKDFRAASDSQFTLLWDSHKDLKGEFKALKDDVSQIKDQQAALANDMVLLRADMIERFAALEKSIARMEVHTKWLTVGLCGFMVVIFLRIFQVI